MCDGMTQYYWWKRHCSNSYLAWDNLFFLFLFSFFFFLCGLYRWTKIEGGDIVRTPILKFRDALRIKISRKHTWGWHDGIVDGNVTINQITTLKETLVMVLFSINLLGHVYFTWRVSRGLKLYGRYIELSLGFFNFSSYVMCLWCNSLYNNWISNKLLQASLFCLDWCVLLTAMKIFSSLYDFLMRFIK